MAVLYRAVHRDSGEVCSCEIPIDGDAVFDAALYTGVIASSDATFWGLAFPTPAGDDCIELQLFAAEEALLRAAGWVPVVGPDKFVTLQPTGAVACTNAVRDKVTGVVTATHEPFRALWKRQCTVFMPILAIDVSKYTAATVHTEADAVVRMVVEAMVQPQAGPCALVAEWLARHYTFYGVKRVHPLYDTFVASCLRHYISAVAYVDEIDVAREAVAQFSRPSCGRGA